jgi:hypothetical protein
LRVTQGACRDTDILRSRRQRSCAARPAKEVSTWRHSHGLQHTRPPKIIPRLHMAKAFGRRGMRNEVAQSMKSSELRSHRNWCCNHLRHKNRTCLRLCASACARRAKRMFIVLRPCDGFPDVSSVALTFVLFVWRCLPIGVSVLTLSLKSGEGMRILCVQIPDLRPRAYVPSFFT